MKLVLVEYYDSACSEGWHKFGETEGISSCVSVGVLKYEDDKQIIIFPNRSDTGNVSDSMAIPKGCIKRIRKVKIK